MVLICGHDVDLEKEWFHSISMGTVRTVPPWLYHITPILILPQMHRNKCDFANRNKDGLPLIL